ncbi:hypothetical protein ACJMK2_002880 [Sinanodonta woodiana]|uniref:Uncharacterized protein n=1 Tax=Sinanodonta woodiana TaxID=1069815 RepID=A0ABD3XYT9_SINWO
MDIIGRRYLLLDQTHILQENEVANKDAKDLKELFHLYNPDEKQNNVAFADETLPSRNLAHLEETGKIMFNKETKETILSDIKIKEN